MVRANNDYTSVTGGEENTPNDELPRGLPMEPKEHESSEVEESQWVAFQNHAPRVIKARFNITEIEVPSSSDGIEGAEENDNSFLQMLIEEGIPVNYLSEQQPVEDSSNVGVILSQSDPKAEETLNLENQDTKTQEEQVDNIVEVIGCSKPISTPLFLHLIPSQSSIHESNHPTAPEAQPRRGSVNPSIIMLPPETTTLPVKKRVRFELPGRKASLIGEYEILRKPVSSFSKHTRKKKSRPSSRNRRSHFSEESSENDDEEPSRRRKEKGVRRCRFKKEDEEVVDSSSSDVEDPVGKWCQEHDDEDSAENMVSEDSGDSVSETCHSDVDIQCGLNTWTPKWLQIFARSECYLVVFCFVALAQGMLYTYNISVVSTLQKRFNMSSAQTGLILSGNDISQILISVLVAFYGTYGDRPKWLGMASLCSAFAAVVAASPHFFFGSGEHANHVIMDPSKVPPSWIPKNSRKLELCGFQMPEDCSPGAPSASETSPVTPTLLLFLSQLLVGVSNSVFWSVGVSYLDDNVSKRKTSLHIAFFTIARVLGPTLGFMLGGYCLSLWIDPTQNVDFAQRDPRWIGAWWLGFLVLSILIGVPGSFYFCFPRQLPQKNRRNYYIQSPLQLSSGENSTLCKTKSPSFYELSAQRFLHGFPSIRALPSGLRRLFRNKIWTANMLSNVFFVLAMSGYWAFKPKYIQTQFKKSASSANFYTGTTTMIASVVSIAVCGIVMRWLRPKTNHVTAYNVFLSMYSVVSMFALMTIHCPSSELAGHLPGQERWACSDHCSCTETFSPICAEDGVTTFFSPCFAGCTAVNLHVNPVEYENCTCFGKVKWQDSTSENFFPTDEDIPFTINEGWAVDGFCPDNCNALTVYLIIQLVNKVVFATGRIGGTLVNLRSVEEKDKTLALGCLAMFVAFAGFVPASFIMGTAIDSACLVWNYKCGERGSCSFYDSEKFRLIIHVVPAALLLLSGVGDLVVHMKNSSLQIYGIPDEEGSEDPEASDEQPRRTRKQKKRERDQSRALRNAR